ncbi:MAG: ImuA family protein [Planctomycetota bacterium]
MKNRRKKPIPLEPLRRQIARLERSRPRGGDGPISSGSGPLDRLLPEGGFHRAALAEWLTAGEGSGATTLALAAARQACQPIGGGLEQSPTKWAGGALVVLDRCREFHPPAAVRLGIEPEDLIVVQADSEADNRWALDQALRCPGVAAVLAWPERLDGRTFRRLQLAAEEGGGLGLLIRPLAARREPSWADVRLLVEPLPAEKLLVVREGRTDTLGATAGLPSSAATTVGQANRATRRRRRLRIHLLRCHGGPSGRNVDLEIDDETHTVHQAARLADPAAYADAAGA